jgi:hypothetical protein
MIILSPNYLVVKMKQITVYIFLFVVFSLTSCGGALAPIDYVHYVENPDNGLFISSNVNGVKYTLQYQPTDYLVMLELKSFSIPPETFKEQYNRFKGMEHYVFHIETKDIEALVSKTNDTSKTENSLLDYFNFRVQKDIKLIEGRDTIPCSIAECESSMGMLPYYSFVIGFPLKNYDGDREFLFDNKKLGTGEIKLLVKGESIKNLPKLKMKE